MTDEKAIEIYNRYKNLIKVVASRNSIQGHPLMNYEDLQGECYVVMSKCLNFVDNYNIEIWEKIFKKSMYNRIKDLWRLVMRKGEIACRMAIDLPLTIHNDDNDDRSPRKIIMDLSKEYMSCGADCFRNMCIKEEITQINNILNGLPKKVFECIIEPSDDLITIVIADHLRKKKIAYQKGRIIGDNVRLMKKHLCFYLECHPCVLIQAIEEIKIKIPPASYLSESLGLI